MKAREEAVQKREEDLARREEELKKKASAPTVPARPAATGESVDALHLYHEEYLIRKYSTCIRRGYC